MSYEMVLQAADYATFAENKMAFINRILANWRQAGVTTLAQAQADHEARLAGGKRRRRRGPDQAGLSSMSNSAPTPGGAQRPLRRRGEPVKEADHAGRGPYLAAAGGAYRAQRQLDREDCERRRNQALAGCRSC